MPFNDHILLKVRRDLLPKNGMGAGLDAGGSLTKAAFIRKGESEDSEFATIELTYFHNQEFTAAMEFVAKHAKLNAGQESCLPATGATTTKNHDVVRRVLGVGCVPISFSVHFTEVSYY